MTHTIEDTIEILSGTVPRNVNIRIDNSDKLLIKSLSRQVRAKIALTDRQLDLVLSKISKYKEGLEKNSVDVDTLISSKTLRMPLREIDRSQLVKIAVCPKTDQPSIAIKFVFNKKLSNFWKEISERLIGNVVSDSGTQYVSLTEHNVREIVAGFSIHNFTFEGEILEIYEKIQEIVENHEKFAPHVDVEGDNIVLKNVNSHFEKWIKGKFNSIDDKNLLHYLDTLKNSGISYKNSKITEKIEKLKSSALSKKIILEKASRFKIDPKKIPLSDLILAIQDINQIPLLVILDEISAFQQTKELHEVFKSHFSEKEMTVFFRLDKSHKNFTEFNNYVKDNQLNNYIDSSTKVVFITKTRIPKPMIRADWHPSTALLMSAHDFGKTATYLNDFSTVYYYNDSLIYRTNKKGNKQIAEL